MVVLNASIVSGFFSSSFYTTLCWYMTCKVIRVPRARHSKASVPRLLEKYLCLESGTIIPAITDAQKPT